MTATAIEDLIVIEEAHLKDPKGNVERRLATITEDRQQVERNPLEIPSPKASDIVRSWPDKMWCKGYEKTQLLEDGGVTFCAVGILAETGGYDWGTPDESGAFEYRWGDGSFETRVARFVEETYPQTRGHIPQIMEKNDCEGKEAAAMYLEELGL